MASVSEGNILYVAWKGLRITDKDGSIRVKEEA
jgi:hypothetical protein